MKRERTVRIRNNFAFMQIWLLILLTFLPFLWWQPVQAAGSTTSLHIVKYASDGTTVIDEKTVPYDWMEKNLPVLGDGITHYYHQGPVFEGDMWDPEETVNLKDKGPVKGTDVKDICDLVGGMSQGDEVVIHAVDGYIVKFAYVNVYEPPECQGPIALCWFKGESTAADEYVGTGYPGNDAYSEAIQIVFMAITTNPEGKHVFGNTDMRISMPEEKYQHFYEGLPSTNGLSGKWIDEVRIYTGNVPENLAAETGSANSAKNNDWIPIVPGVVGFVVLCLALFMVIKNRGFKTKSNKLNVKALSIFILGVVCVVASVTIYVSPLMSAGQDIKWDLTIVGTDGEARVLSYDQIKSMPSYEGKGGFFTTVGVVNGPFKVKGVLLKDLCMLTGDFTKDNIVMISAKDGYSMIFDSKQLAGDIETYDPATLHEVPHNELNVLLIYELDGKPLSQFEGMPLRIAVVGDADLLTEGHYWVKWVNQIEVMNLQ